MIINAFALAPVNFERPSVNRILRDRRELLANIKTLPNYAFRAAAILAKCRTLELGMHAEVKCLCGRILMQEDSCRYRFCPLCSVRRSNMWLAKWMERHLPVEHLHLVFTLPHDLNFFWRHYPAQMGRMFFEAVSRTLSKLLRDPQWLGGCAGIIAMLQTWDNELKYHPHMHILITFGGADKDGMWIPPTRGPEYFIPAFVISEMFSEIFMSLVRKAEYSGEINAPAGWGFSRRMKFLDSVEEMAFVVRIFGPYPHGVGVLKYFASHVCGGPIANSKILSVTDTHVTFQMKPRPHLTELKCTLPIEQFIERYLSHIPPPGFHSVRTFGLYSSSSHVKVKGLPAPVAIEDAIPDDEKPRCPRCRLPLFVRNRGDLKKSSRPLAPSHSFRAHAPARASPMVAVV